MHDSTTLSKRSIPELKLAAGKLDINTNHFGSNQKLYVDATIRQQNQFLKNYFSCQPECRKTYSRQLRHLASHIEAQLTHIETTLATSFTDTFDPVIFTLQNEAKKVNKAVELINEAIEILNECELN
jgi:hypothetical protein